MKKRRKLKKNVRKGLLIIVLIIIIGGIFLANRISTIRKVGYSMDTSLNVLFSDDYKYITSHKYNKVIDKYITDDNFNSKYLNKYYDINYVKDKNFLKNVNKLIKNGYEKDDINIVIRKKDNALVDYLAKYKVDDISKYLEYDYFKTENLKRYIEYNTGDYQDAIISINIGLDKEYYKDPNIIKKYSTKMIVNKYNRLEKDYKPKDLEVVTKCSTGNNYLAKDAKIAYEKMCEGAKNDDMKIEINSSYRSYEEQEETYNLYLDAYGENYAKSYVALPGFSEHQTGLAVDVKSLDEKTFKNSKEYIWMQNNSYKYGFIYRYENGKEDITGFNGEAWHFRYVGEKAAKYIYEHNLTYEEYYAMNY